ncbi:MAG: tRNA (adenosine(37)-N6)-threonylcarbamoyltransferase complex ATPase subunit type 1 TsaE [Ignavibacteriaceae bacterium]|nr:tRNA (adenosine(37)-N6)-threonylcarbamoyltransferase complex ATPase subunit type 1 TsaE [Ignavibacteriaceae bacterium]
MVIPSLHKVFTEQDTEKLAFEFSSLLEAGEVIILNGNLGTGKTYFIKSVLKSFEVFGVNSPTFSIVNEYNADRKYYHFDFYRIEALKELYDIGFEEYMNDEEAVKFIEWGNLFPIILPHKRTEIEIKLNDDFSRDFHFRKQ